MPNAFGQAYAPSIFVETGTFTPAFVLLMLMILLHLLFNFRALTRSIPAPQRLRGALYGFLFGALCFLGCQSARNRDPLSACNRDRSVEWAWLRGGDRRGAAGGGRRATFIGRLCTRVLSRLRVRLVVIVGCSFSRPNSHFENKVTSGPSSASRVLGFGPPLPVGSLPSLPPAALHHARTRPLGCGAAGRAQRVQGVAEFLASLGIARGLPSVTALEIARRGADARWARSPALSEEA
jgi:hypothetical protein